MNTIAELRKAAETLKSVGEPEVCGNAFLWPDDAAYFPDLPMASGETLAAAHALAANALPKLLAVAKAAQECAETGENLLGLMEALRELEEAE